MGGESTECVFIGQGRWGNVSMRGEMCLRNCAQCQVFVCVIRIRIGDLVYTGVHWCTLDVHNVHV